MSGLLSLENRDNIICAAYTIGGPRGAVPLEQRAAAAAKAGFRKLGLTREQYLAEREVGRSDADLRAILAHYGVENVEIEFLIGWAGTSDNISFPPGRPLESWRQRERDLYALTDALGARHMNCGEIGFCGPLAPIDVIAERFAGICDRAKEHGLKVMMEFLPMADIVDCAMAWEIVRRADRPNAGVLIDSWHFFRGTADFDQIRAVPPEKIMAIQINDSKPPYGDLRQDTISARRVPGDGEFDLKRLLTLLDDMGVVAPISVEVLSDELAALGPEEAAKRAYQGARAVLDAIASG